MTLERWVALVVATGLLVCLAVTKSRAHRRGDGLVTPLSVFQFVWAGALGLFAIPWVRYSSTSVEVWTAIYGSILTFSVGACVAEAVRRRSTPPDQGQREQPDSQRLRRTWVFFALVGLVGFAAFVHAVDAVLGWQAIFRQPSLVRDIQSTSTIYAQEYGPWKLLTYCNQVAFMLWTIGIRERAFSRWWRPAYGLGAISLLPYVFTGDRTLMLTTLIWALFFHLIYRNPVSPRRLAVLGAGAMVCAVMVFGVLGARVGKSIDSHPEITASLTSTTFDQLALPYVYVSGNPATLTKFADDPIRPQTNGQLTVLPAVKLLHGLGLVGQPPEVVGAFYPIPFETFNNYSWLGGLYSDFGLVGCFLVPFFVGYVCTAVFTRARNRRTILGYWSASLLLYCIAFTPMLPKFSDTLTWQYLLLGPLVARLIRPGPSFSDLRRRGSARLRAHPKSSLALGVTAAAVSVAALVSVSAVTAPAGLPSTREAIVEKLQLSARRAELTRRGDHTFPTAVALASRLHVRDPAVTYVSTETADRLPTDPRTIGVYTNARRMVLSAQFDRSGAVALDNASRNASSPIARVVGEAPLDRQLVANGGFTDGFATWEVSGAGIARFALASRGYRGRGIAVRGRSQRGQPVAMRQALHITAPAQSCFTFQVRVRRTGLNRPLVSWMRFIYTDGSSDAHVLGRAKKGIPPGTDRWRRLRVSGRSRKPLGSLVAYLADTGAEPLRGTTLFDDIQIVRTC